MNQTIEITSLDHPALTPYARLTEAQLLNRLHPDQGLFICESLKVIRVALEHGIAPVSFLCEEKFLSQVPDCGVPVYYGSRKVSYVDGSYTALGNDGNHFNKSINSPANQAVPSSVADALYNMSDHLPVIMDLAVDVSPVSVSAPSVADYEVHVVNPVKDQLQVSILPTNEEDMLIELYSLEGKLLMREQQRVSTDGARLFFDFPYTSGFYLLKITDSHNACIIKKLVK